MQFRSQLVLIFVVELFTWRTLLFANSTNLSFRLQWVYTVRLTVQNWLKYSLSWHYCQGNYKAILRSGICRSSVVFNNTAMIPKAWELKITKPPTLLDDKGSTPILIKISRPPRSSLNMEDILEFEVRNNHYAKRHISSSWSTSSRCVIALNASDSERGMSQWLTHQYGWTSTWLMTTGCLLYVRISLNLGTLILETPMCFTSLSSTHFSNACHVSCSTQRRFWSDLIQSWALSVINETPWHIKGKIVSEVWHPLLWHECKSI